MKRGLIIGIPILTMIFGFFLALSFQSVTTEQPMDKAEGVTLIPAYHVTQYRPGEGIIYEADVGNLITNGGLNIVRDKIAVGKNAGNDSISEANCTYMALTNDSKDPAITDTNLSAGDDGGSGDITYPGEFTTGGLERTVGEVSFGSNAGTDDPGNWSVSWKWTATGDYNVWKFGIFNGSKLWDGSEQDVPFSIGNFTANVSMQTNDELTVNVTYIVS